MDDQLFKAGRDAVKQNLQSLVHLLEVYPPFDRMHTDNLQALLSRGSLAFYAAGEAIVGPEDGVCNHLFIVRQGLVSVAKVSVSAAAQGEEADLEPDTEALLVPGDMFPLGALLGERSTQRLHVAAEDTFCILIAKADVLEILKRSEPLRLFAFSGVSSLFGQLYEQARQTAYEQSSPSISLSTPVKNLVQRETVTCPPGITVSGAVGIMHKEAVSSIVVNDDESGLLGIFTLRDLRRIVAQGHDELQHPVADVMSANLVTVSHTSSAFEAAMLMAQHHIGHICVTDGDALVGVISERDVFALQRVDLVHLSRQLRYASNTQNLIEARSDIPALVTMMLAHGANANQLMDVVTQLNDHTCCRAIELCLEKHPEIDFTFNWMLFGSEGRGEQTLFSDQDNAILFEAEGAEQTEQRRGQLVAFAHGVNTLLDECGLAWCKGNIMASNPKLCLSLTEWKATFSRLVENPSPRHLLESSIYFDLRCLWGKPTAFNVLRRYLQQLCVEHTRFQRALARAAMLNKPPAVDTLRSLLGATLGTRTQVDVKYQGLSPFVDSIRVLALSTGCIEVSTHERIRHLIQRGVLPKADARSYAQAFNYLQLLRMQQHQEQIGLSEELSNRIEPGGLDPLDKRMLREALRQARHLQTMMKLRYRI
ncbi:DUF294 nucleotidyltransferase-like domain-containing protein [Paenalcaligenes niemegkensis]|uniref:DUF294 nucleotidyltransferase-like domain-containing protein n=1 Tax=Paenalcaligenes niemegkensis TaxID=2895469 RepID=UPI001EE9A544|nr:DUF294 nucleotidyltransferase-like domain-containing protein [Paenalcaligenes niemegkensis]MCQ9615996.1 DUF294 nucleotidyltransferase-like domain-containing protein [Paenalcaligenes niemegkensis]